MASRDTAAPKVGFDAKVLAVLKDPSGFPPEFAAFVRSEVVRNPLVKIEPYQLPKLDKKHKVGDPGEPAFLNSWSNYSGGWDVATFYKDNESCVHLQGLVQGGTPIPGAIFTLPAGYRPLGQLIFVILSNDALGRAEVWPDGTVYVRTGAAAWVNLSGISFRTL